MKVSFNEEDLIGFLTNKIKTEQDTDTLCAYAESIMGLPSGSMEYDPELESFSADISTDDVTEYGIFPDDVKEFNIKVE